MTWRGIAICSAKVICDLMIDIVISVNNNSCCMFPNSIPISITDSSSQHFTSFVNAYIIRTWCFSLINILQKLQNICWQLWSCKFCPCYHNTAWCTDGLYTVISGWTKKVRRWRRILIIMAPSIWSSSLWIPNLRFSRPLQHSMNSWLNITSAVFSVFIPFWPVCSTCRGILNSVICTVTHKTLRCKLYIMHIT